MRSRESAPALLAALRHGPDEARIRAARALGRIGSPAAVGPLVDATAAEQARSLRIVALGALASIGDRRLAPQLAALLADADGRVAQAAARALAALGEPGEEALRQAAGAPASCQPADGLGSGACQAAAELGPGSRAALHARSALATVDLARERAGRRGRAS